MKLFESLFGAKCAECGQRIKSRKFPALSPGWICESCNSQLAEERKRKDEERRQSEKKAKRQPKEQEHQAPGQKHKQLDLHGAAKEGDLQQVKMLLIRGRTRKAVAVNAKNRDGVTALHLAAAWGHRDVAELLLANGANANSKASGEDASTPLHFAATYGKNELVELLLSKGAKVNAQSSVGAPLNCAAYWGRLTVVKLLLAKGADVNAQEKDGLTALHDAANQGHLEIVKLLLDRGADINAKYTERVTALDFAVDKGHSEIAALLNQYPGQRQSDSSANGRRIVSVPGENGEIMRVVAGTAYVDDHEYPDGLVMAECEDGKVRLIKRTGVPEFFVALINGTKMQP